MKKLTNSVDVNMSKVIEKCSVLDGRRYKLAI